MATRLAKAFGADAADLRRRQTNFDAMRASERASSIAVRSYARSPLDITARQIEAWAEQRSSRSEMAVLLRRLINSTGESLERVDFPGHENAERHGWDGYILAAVANPWIPRGRSGWEFGVNEDPKRKADGDYRARTDGPELSPAERCEITFVFVTPRNWPGKTAWEAARRSEGEWKDVRAYDASDLEQWLEASVPAGAWLGEALPLRSSGFQSLEASWTAWAGVTARPASPLPKGLFDLVAETAGQKLAGWLSGPPERPFVVAADSAEEALAAFVCACDTPAAVEQRAGERAVVVRTVEALAKVTLASGPGTIIVVASPAVEAAVADAHRTRHTVIARSRPGVVDADVLVGLIDADALQKALLGMGLDGPTAERRARESGRSRTVLRRRLSPVPAIRNPLWANDAAIARCLIPLMLVGHWNAETEADRAVMAGLCGVDYDEVERTVADLIRMEDSPLWSVGRVRGVVSKVDALYAVAGRIIGGELERFLDYARVVLSEADPSLDLPEDKRWMASIYGATRKHSSLLRGGICETLILLSVHGNSLLRERIGVDVEGEVARLVRTLLTPLDGPTWQSQRNDLPRYAEASPVAFLDILGDDLRSPSPKVFAIMKPAGAPMVSSPQRTGLLWALEALAWNPRWLPQVVDILGRLSAVPLNDNWVNKPENSLQGIFRAWLPQTAASLADRLDALSTLVRRHPAVGWRVCLEQIRPGPAFASPSAKPSWRSDVEGVREDVTASEDYAVRRRALDHLIAWPGHDERTLGDLVENAALPPADQEAVWNAVMQWAASGPSDEARAALRERIRQATMTLPARRRRKNGSSRATDAYEALAPRDPVLRHGWLFEQSWIQESVAEIEDEKFDYEERARRVSALRVDALREVWSALGFEGVVRLCEAGATSWMVGQHLLESVLLPDEAEAFVIRLAGLTNTSARKLESLLSGLLSTMAPDYRRPLLDRFTRRGSRPRPPSDQVVDSILRCSPFDAETWSFMDRLPTVRRARYWKEVWVPYFVRNDAGNVDRVVDELLDAGRPLAAFSAVEMVFSKVASDRLVRLLHAVAAQKAGAEAGLRLRPHHISDAFEELSRRADVPAEELVRLEFRYLDALAHTKHGIKNLERAVAGSPELFTQLLGLAFKRDDGTEEASEAGPEAKNSRRDLAVAAYEALGRVRCVPGTRQDGTVDATSLRNWIASAREQARTQGRLGSADRRIGALLAAGNADADSVWPPEEVREALEEFGNEAMADGLQIARYNARGVVCRTPGGGQERDLAAQYREWSRRISNRHPFTSRMLEKMATTYDGEAARHDTEEAIRQRVERW